MEANGMDHPIVSNLQPTTIVQNSHTKAVYRLAAVAALLIVVMGLTDAFTSMGMEAHDNRTIKITEWFALFQSDWFAAFSRLGVINMITLSLGIPVYLAFNHAFPQHCRARVAFASILFFTGTAIYLASNTVFPLFALSQQYAAAPAAQKLLLEAAGQALLAQGADLTPGTFYGLFFTQVAGLLITSMMLRDNGFGKWAGGLGLVGFALMSVFFILTAFLPEYYGTAMMISAPGGLLLMAYQLMLARRFLLMSK